MDYKKFIERQIAEIRETVGDGLAINALSGGVDSSVCTVLGHRALGTRLKTVFIDNGLMRENEPARVVALFRKMRIRVELVDAREEFLSALKGITDPEQKRQSITETFYKKVVWPIGARERRYISHSWHDSYGYRRNGGRHQASA